MPVPCKFERSLLSHEEYETIRLTHHPAIHDVEAGERGRRRAPRLSSARAAAAISESIQIPPHL